MTEQRIGDITIRPFDAERDSEPVEVVVGEIWSGGDDALIEKEFGVIGGRRERMVVAGHAGVFPG